MKTRSNWWTLACPNWSPAAWSAQSRPYHGRHALIPRAGNREHEDQDPVAGFDTLSARGFDLSDGTGAIDNKVDACRLGVTLYVMLVARFPVYDRDQDGTIVGASRVGGPSQDSRRLLLRLLAADPVQRLSATDALQDPGSSLVGTGAHATAVKPRRRNGNHQRKRNRQITPWVAAHAHAAFVASSALGLPPELRSAGLDYHERAVASRALATKLRGTALLVLEMIDDLKAALDARNATPLEKCSGPGVWTSILKRSASCQEGQPRGDAAAAQAVGEEAPSMK